MVETNVSWQVFLGILRIYSFFLYFIVEIQEVKPFVKEIDDLTVSEKADMSIVARLYSSIRETDCFHSFLLVVVCTQSMSFVFITFCF